MAEIERLARGGAATADAYRALPAPEREAYMAAVMARPIVHASPAAMRKIRATEARRAKMLADLADLRDADARALSVDAELAR